MEWSATSPQVCAAPAEMDSKTVSSGEKSRSPSSPPRQVATPAETNPQVCPVPAASETKVPVRSPWPKSFRPQHVGVPSSSSAQAWDPAIAKEGNVPSGASSCPCSLSPQQWIPPSDSSPHEWLAPTPRAVNSKVVSPVSPVSPVSGGARAVCRCPQCRRGVYRCPLVLCLPPCLGLQCSEWSCHRLRR